MTGHSHEKGARAERLVASYLQAHGYPYAERRGGEGKANDRGDLDGLPLYFVSVKYVSRRVASMPAWWRQAVAGAERTDRAPLLIVVFAGLPVETSVTWDAGGRYRLEEWAKMGAQ